MKNKQLEIGIINGILDVAKLSNINELKEALTEISMIDIDFSSYGVEYSFYIKETCKTTTINAIFKEIKIDEKVSIK